MASLTSPRLPYAETESKPQRSFPIERRPRMLKDFLSENSNSISSNGFKSFPRQSTVRHFLELDVKSDNVVTSKLLRSRSKAASTTISAIHKASEILINAVRHLPFVSVKSPSPSVSRRLLKREFWKKCRNDDVGQISVTVKVKDILRWRSFRDLVEEKKPPLDFSCSPYAGSTTSSNSYNWCESEFTEEYLPLWSTDSVEVGKKSLLEFGVGRDTMEATTGETVDPKGELLLEEKELHSPVSVHDFPFEEDEESFPSSFHQRLANMEENTCRFEQEGKEENSVKATSAAETCEANVDHLLLDFFRHELTSKNQKDYEFGNGMVRVSKAWIDGEYDIGLFDWEMDDTRESHIRDIERGLRWSKFEEQEQVALEMEIGVLNNLMDELLVDLFVC